MDQERTKWRRHDYVTVSSDGREAALRQAVKNRSEEEQALIKELLTYSSKEAGVPGIIKRQENARPGFVQVGWSSWERFRGVRFRISAEIPEETIKSRTSPYEVFQREERWPKELRGQLEALKKLGISCGIEIGLIGSLGLEIVTGLPYRDRESDLDFIIRKKKGADLSGFYEDVKKISGSRLDMELQIPGAGGVKLEDWMAPERLVVVKGLYKVELVEKSKCED